MNSASTSPPIARDTDRLIPFASSWFNPDFAGYEKQPVDSKSNISESKHVQ